MNNKKIKNGLLLMQALLLACAGMYANAATGHVASSKDIYKGSQANNKSLASLREDVNEATGQFSVSLSLLSIKGYIPLDLSIRYSAGTPGTHGLPKGWTYNLDLVIPGKSVTYNDTSYIIDPDWQDNSGYRSGLRYLNQHGIRFTDRGNQALPRPYQHDHYEHYYRYVLGFADGSHDYFDAAGKLIARDDRFGNHIVYAYANPDASVFNTVLSSIRDSLGQTFHFSNQGGKLAWTFTDSMKRSHTRQIYHDARGVKTFIDALGNHTDLEYTSLNGTDVISSISYPSGLQTTIHYQGLPFRSKDGRTGAIPAVREIVHYDLTQDKILSDIHYSGYRNLNYTGYPYYALSSNKDNLLENIRRIHYHYTVNKTRVMSDGRSLRTTTVYNTESEPVEISIYLPDDTEGTPTYRTLLQYKAEPNRHARTVNYSKPVEVRNQVFDPGNHDYLTLVKTRMLYDPYGEVSRAEQYSYQPLSGKLVKISETINTYADSWHLPLTQKTLLWQPSSQSWKSMEKHNTLTPDHKGIATTVTSMNGQAWKKFAYTYDAHGVKRSTTLSWMDEGHQGADHIKTSLDYQYDSEDHVNTMTQTNALGFSSRRIVDTTTGKVLQIISPRGESTRYRYDLEGRVLSVTYPDRSRITFSYTGYQQDRHNSVLETSALGVKRKTETDAFGRTVGIWMNTDTAHPGAMILQAARTYDRTGKVSIEQDRLGNRTFYTHNLLGLVTSIMDRYKNETRIDYHDSELSRTITVNGIRQARIISDPAGKTVKNIVYSNSYNPDRINYHKVSIFSYDGGHHLVRKTSSIQDLDSGKSTVLNSSILQYDPDYQIIKETISQGHTTINIGHDYDLTGNVLSQSRQINDHPIIRRDRYRYDKAGRLTSEVWPNGSSIDYTYDRDGLLTGKVLPDGSMVSYAYDSNGRETRRDWHDSHGQAHHLIFSHDKDGNLVSIMSDDKKETFAYDTSGRLIRHTYCSRPDCDRQKQSIYTYNKHGQRVQVQDVNGNLTQYGYNGQGQISRIRGPHDSVTYSYTGPDHPNENKHYGELDVTRYVGLYHTRIIRDSLGRVIKTEKTSPSGAQILSVGYRYDNLDFLREAKVTSAVYPENPDLNYTAHYQYDDLGRLIAESKTDVKSGQDSIHYTYDDNNNLLKYIKNGVVTDYKYNNLDQLVSRSVAGKTFYPAYDRNGRETSNGSGWEYQYSISDQLVMARSGEGHNVHYTYHPDGLRATRRSSGSVYSYYYQGSRINAINSNHGENTGYLFSGGTRAGSYTTTSRGDLKTVYYINDNKSNVLTMKKTRQSGLVSGSTYYDPYGKHNKTLKTGTATSFTYNGEYEDPETGLIYLKARDYDRNTGRFMTMDSHHVWNKYAFADANPIMNIDPSGHSPVLNYALNGVAFVGSVAAAFAGQPEGLAVVSAELFTTAAVTGAVSALGGLTTQALVDAHAIRANSSAAKALNLSSQLLAVPGLIVTIADAGAFIAGKLSAGFMNSRYIIKFVSNREAAELQVEHWNRYYLQAEPKYATAKVLGNTRIRLPRIPGEVATFEIVRANQAKYNDFALARDKNLLLAGLPPLEYSFGEMDNAFKPGNIVFQRNPEGGVEFYQTGFGENITRETMDMGINNEKLHPMWSSMIKCHQEWIKDNPPVEQLTGDAFIDYIYTHYMDNVKSVDDLLDK